MIKVFLDANILYSNTVRSLLIWLHVNRVLQIYWSIEAWEEAFTAYARSNDETTSTRFRTSMTKNAIAEYPECLVSQFVVKPFGLKDPDDEHILAAAIKSDAEFLITKDEVLISDPKIVAAFKLIRPDDLLVNELIVKYPNSVRQSVKDHIASLSKTKPTFDIYLQSLRRNDLLKFVEWLKINF